MYMHADEGLGAAPLLSLSTPVKGLLARAEQYAGMVKLPKATAVLAARDVFSPPPPAMPPREKPSSTMPLLIFGAVAIGLVFLIRR